MSAKDPLIYVAHVRDSCQRICEYTLSAGPNWTSNPLVMDAVCRNITIIGEAARNLDASFREAHSDVPWSAIIGARNVVMHAYEYLRPELIRKMAEEDVPVLLTTVRRILETS